MRKRSKLFTKLAIGIIVGTVVFVSCQTQDELITPDIDDFESFVSEGEEMVLGEQLENPYSVENMRKALANLRANGRTSDFDIETTDLYIRFLPADSLEYDAIAADTTIELFDHPLDFEIEQEGNWYHDPSIPDHLPTYQYTVVKPDHVFPDTIEHEILAELFLPEEVEEEIENGRVAIDVDFLDALEDESLKLTGNWEEELTIPNARCRRRCWNPSGRIRVRERLGNNSLGWLPVENVKVRVRRWFTIKTDYTDANGNYWVSHRFRRAVNYSVKFETPYAKISNWIGWDTRHDGPKRKGVWNVDFNWHSKSWVRATLINAIVEYRVQYHRTGIQNPYPISYWAGGEAVNKLNVRAVFNDGRSDWSWARANRIRMYTRNEGSSENRETDDLYRSMFHELSHQSHFKLNAWRFSVGNSMIVESWAHYIELIFIDEYYSNIYPSRFQGYHWDFYGEEDRWSYTALFEDLADDNNQLITITDGEIRPNDNVIGYTTRQMQEAVRKSRTLNQLERELRKVNNPTSEHLGELFDFYKNVVDTYR